MQFLITSLQTWCNILLATLGMTPQKIQVLQVLCCHTHRLWLMIWQMGDLCKFTLSFWCSHLKCMHFVQVIAINNECDGKSLLHLQQRDTNPVSYHLITLSLRLHEQQEAFQMCGCIMWPFGPVLALASFVGEGRWLKGQQTELEFCSCTNATF